MNSRKGTGKARRKIARLGCRASIHRAPNSGEQCDWPAHRIEPQHLEIASGRSKRAGVDGAVNHNLAIGGDVADGRHRLDEKKRRQGDEDQDERRAAVDAIVAASAHAPARSPSLHDRQRPAESPETRSSSASRARRRTRRRRGRVALPRTSAFGRGPHARHGEVGKDDHQRRRDIVLHVVRVANGQRGDSEEERRRDSRASVGQTRAQPVDRGNRCRAGGDTQRRPAV